MIGLYVYFFFGLFFWLTALMVFIRAKEKAFYLFCGYIIINGLGIITRSIEFNGMMQTYPHLSGLLHPFQFLYGPLYLFFLVKMFNQKHFFRKREIFHFIPFLFALIDTLPYYFFSAEQKVSIIQTVSSYSFFSISKSVYDSLKGISYGLYFFWGLGYYTFYLNTSRVHYVKEIRITHFWFRMDLALKLIAFFSFIYFQVIKKQTTYTVGFYLFSLDSLFNVLVIYFYPSLLNGIYAEKSRNELKLRHSFYYLYRSLKVLLNFSATDNDVLNYLKFGFKVRRIHINPNTNARLLSKNLSIREQRLNEISIKKYGCSLDEFINYKRLESFVLQYGGEGDMRGIVPTLFQCGFNSIIDFQTCLEDYLSYPKKEFLKVSPELVTRLQGIMTETISKN